MFLVFHILWLLGGNVRNVKFNDPVIHNDHFLINHARKASMENSWRERASLSNEHLNRRTNMPIKKGSPHLNSGSGDA